MKITLLDGTTKNPLSCVGVRAGVCWNAPIDNEEKNRKRGLNCIKSGHGRTLEFVNVELVIDEVSARCMREIYTHIGGGPTRLQSSTRYVSEKDGFQHFTPGKIKDVQDTDLIYQVEMNRIQDTYNKLLERGVPVEDAANILPLGMNSKMILKCNLRMLINFMNQRLCTRAYHEIRAVAKEIKKQLSELSEEWAWIADNLFVPKCEVYKYQNPMMVFCVEDHCCGKHKKIENLKVE